MLTVFVCDIKRVLLLDNYKVKEDADKCTVGAFPQENTDR